MNIIESSVMGVVQGLSEFLPISSSAHLVFASNLFKIPEGNEVVFLDIMLHLGTLIAVFIYFKKEIWAIVKALLNSIKTRDFSAQESKIGLYLILGTAITVAMALPMESFAEKLISSPAIVGILLFMTGILLFVSEYISKKQASERPDCPEITLKTSIWIAIAQGLAVLPGFSRSGWTIAAGLFRGLSREQAAQYSFLLSIPIILGSSMVYPFLKFDLADAASFNWTAILVGTLVSGVVGYFCIKYFIKFVSKFSLAVFGYYCVIMGVAATAFFRG